MRLDGRVALVTGSGRGLGKGTALELAKEGADVVINDLNMDDANAVSREIIGMGRRSMVIKADVSNSKEVDAMIDKIVAEMGKLDILVNNAGFTQHVSLVDTTDEDWDRMMRVHVYGCFYCSRAAVRHMMKQKYGKIVSLSSVSAKRGGGVWGATHYSTAKAAIIGFTKSLAREVGQYNIMVNAVAPGVIKIPISDPNRLAAKEAAGKSTPLGRQGEPIEIAKSILFLVSDDSSYITGEIMDINGGLYMD